MRFYYFLKHKIAQILVNNKLIRNIWEISNISNIIVKLKGSEKAWLTLPILMQNWFFVGKLTNYRAFTSASQLPVHGSSAVSFTELEVKQ